MYLWGKDSHQAFHTISAILSLSSAYGPHGMFYEKFSGIQRTVFHSLCHLVDYWNKSFGLSVDSVLLL